MSYMSPFLILFWVWVTDYRRNRLYIGQLFNSMNDQDLFSAQKCDSLPHTLLLFVWLLTFNVPTPKSKTATELEHAHTLSSYWDGFFSVTRNDHSSHKGSNLLPSDIMASALITTPRYPMLIYHHIKIYSSVKWQKMPPDISYD